MTGGNLFAGLPGAKLDAEQVCGLLDRPGLKIERIVSTGQASPPGFWYDQPWDEWVALLQGAARLRFEDEAQARELVAGDYVHIPAHARHRVEATSESPPAIWLAVHFEPDLEDAP
jgi:cupin 2 domain-containing protein